MSGLGQRAFSVDVVLRLNLELRVCSAGVQTVSVCFVLSLSPGIHSDTLPFVCHSLEMPARLWMVQTRELGSFRGCCFPLFWIYTAVFSGTRGKHTLTGDSWFPPVLAQIIPLEHTISLEQDRPRQTWAKIMFKMPSGLGSQFQNDF